MTMINSTAFLSGLAVQQKYGAPGIAGGGVDRGRARTVMPSGDTVEISSEAWSLFHAQTNGNTDGAQSAGDGDRMDAEGNISGRATGGRVSVEDQISQLESELSGLEGEIAALEGKAETDALAAAVLRSKQAQRQLLQAKLTGLLAKSYQIS